MVRQLVGRRRLERCLTWVNMNYEFMVALVLYIPKFSYHQIVLNHQQYADFVCASMCPKIFILFGPKLVPHEENDPQSQFVPIYMALKSSLKLKTHIYG